MPEDMAQFFDPSFVVPLVLLLCSDKLPSKTATGKLYEVGGGRVSRTRWQRSGGHSFAPIASLAPEDLLEKWSLITAFDSRADSPESPAEGSSRIMANIQKHAKKVGAPIICCEK